MKWVQALNFEDRVVVGSMVLTLAGVGVGALRAEPRAFGLTALLVMSLLLMSSWLTHSLRLSWLLLVWADRRPGRAVGRLGACDVPGAHWFTPITSAFSCWRRRHTCRWAGR